MYQLRRLITPRSLPGAVLTVCRANTRITIVLSQL